MQIGKVVLLQRISDDVVEALDRRLLFGGRFFLPVFPVGLAHDVVADRTVVGRQRLELAAFEPIDSRPGCLRQRVGEQLDDGTAQLVTLLRVDGLGLEGGEDGSGVGRHAGDPRRVL